MTDVPRIALLPVGNPDRRALEDLARDLSGMGFDVELGRAARAAAGERSMPGAASAMPMPCSPWCFRSGLSACSQSPTSTSTPTT